MVMQWTADGSEFVELNFGGAGATDNHGAAGDSRTGGRHILGIAEHGSRTSATTRDYAGKRTCSANSWNDYEVVNWLRADAIIARMDPIAREDILPLIRMAIIACRSSAT